MNELEWRSETEFAVGGVNFQCSIDDYTRKTDSDRVVILKNRAVLESYREVFAGLAPRNALEFGIFEGGSPILFTLWFGLDKFVGLDISQPVPGFDEFRRRHPSGSKIRAHYEVDQTDGDRIGKILDAEFGDTPIDLVIDDASHLYAHSRRSFEIAFPRLRPGGVYVIEDWGWAHWPHCEFLMNESALSILVMELIMMCATNRSLLSEVRVFPSFAFVRKSPNAPEMTNFSLDDAYTKRGVEIVSSDDFNLRGIAGVLGQRARELCRRKVKSVRKRMPGYTARR